MDDGEISFKNKTKSFFNCIISPIKNLFKSSKKFILRFGAIAGITALFDAKKISDLKNIPETSDENLPEGVPDYLYHMTSKDNYNKILESGKLKLFDFESGRNDCIGVYLVDKDNLIHHWMGCKNQELFGDKDVGAQLLFYIGAKSDSGIVAIKIPTKKLNLSKLVFRPFIRYCKLTMEGLDHLDIKKNELITSGWKLDELSKYIGQEAVEFVYKEEIPTSSFSGIKSSQGNIPYSDIIRNLYE